MSCTEDCIKVKVDFDFKIGKKKKPPIFRAWRQSHGFLHILWTSFAALDASPTQHWPCQPQHQKQSGEFRTSSNGEKTPFFLIKITIKTNPSNSTHRLTKHLGAMPPPLQPAELERLRFAVRNEVLCPLCQRVPPLKVGSGSHITSNIHIFVVVNEIKSFPGSKRRGGTSWGAKRRVQQRSPGPSADVT